MDFLSLDTDSLHNLVLSIFQKAGLLESCKYSVTTLERFCRTVSNGYRPNPYHNFSHAVMVLWNSHRFIESVKDIFERSELLTLLVSSLCHDLDHRGKGNLQLLEAKESIALLYPVSPLEANTVSLSLPLLDDEQHNLLEFLDVDERKTVKELFRDFIMATDVGTKATVETAESDWLRCTTEFDKKRADHRKCLLRMILLSADISNTAEPFPVFLQWADALFNEWHAANPQLTYSAFYDGQCKFLNGYAKKLFTQLHNPHILPTSLTSSLLEKLELNLKHVTYHYQNSPENKLVLQDIACSSSSSSASQTLSSSSSSSSSLSSSSSSISKKRKQTNLNNVQTRLKLQKS